MDRNPSPPPSRRDGEEEEENDAGGGCIGSTVYSKHWLFGVLSGLIQIVTPENGKSSSEDEEQEAELDEEMENEICRVWDMSMDEKSGSVTYQKCCRNANILLVIGCGRTICCVYI